MKTNDKRLNALKLVYKKLRMTAIFESRTQVFAEESERRLADLELQHLIKEQERDFLSFNEEIEE